VQLSRLDVDNIDDEPPPEDTLKKQIKRLSKHYNVQFKLANLSFKNIKKAPLPLAFWHPDKGFALLVRLSDEQALVQYYDSEQPQLLTIDELKAYWSAKVILLHQPAARFDATWFIPEFVRHRKLLTDVLLLSLMIQLLALATPLFFQVVMDKVLVHNALSTLDVLVFTLVIVGIFEVIITGLKEYLFVHTTSRIDINLGVKLFQHLLALPLLYFKNRQVGAIITRVQELDSIRSFLTGSMLTLGVDVLFSFVFFAVMAYISPLLTAIVLATLPVYFLVAYLSTSPLQQRIERQFQTSAQNTSFLNESVSAAETIKSLAVEPQMRRRWESQTQEMVDAGFRTQTLGAAVSHSVTLLQKVTSVLVIWIGATLVMDLKLTIGQLIAFNMMVSHVTQPMAKLIDLWQQFIQARVAVDKLAEMLNMPVDKDQQLADMPTQLKGHYLLQRLEFKYRPDLPPVLDGINLEIKAGESIGVVGPSGSGKSTLARLLMKLYSPDSGSILLDGVPMAQIDAHQLRQNVGVVLQENFLFNRTVRQNIALHDPSISFERVVEAAKLAGAHDFILKMPQGYDTVLSEAGRSISGGQRQRVAIARALVNNPSILIFDEATSALDDESQAIVQANMAQIAQGRTVIIIAHRLTTVRNCDRIITLEKGRITESGEHHALLTQGGTYARLWELQQNLSKETLL